ncbi:NACHT domain-containing protein [Candidatus Neptunichlamydia sp. REUL1]|uniref:NACHT domain-containing protein n=1 Tax=Candidatus Neptunichlamydia sp. REUL1 TaxID=3064277 RepID=UPI00292D6D57|nr:hypothetical protein [Candidatus Neptunochlamydia sp. REUL1]
MSLRVHHQFQLNQLSRTEGSPDILNPKLQDLVKLMQAETCSLPVQKAHQLQDRQALIARIAMYKFQLETLKEEGMPEENLFRLHVILSSLSHSLCCKTHTIVTDPLTGERFSPLQIALLGGGCGVSQEAPFLDLSNSYKPSLVSPDTPDATQRYKEKAEQLLESASFMRDSDSRAQVMQAIQWITRFQPYALEAILPKKAEESLSDLLESLKIVLDIQENLVGAALAELSHAILNKIFETTQKDSSYCISEKAKEKWLEILEHGKKKITTHSHLPTNALTYEIDIIKRGVNILADTKKTGKEALEKIVGGALKSVVAFSIDPSFFEGLKEGALYLGKKLYHEHEAKAFKTILYLESCQADLKQTICNIKENVSSSMLAKKIVAILSNASDPAKAIRKIRAATQNATSSEASKINDILESDSLNPEEAIKRINSTLNPIEGVKNFLRDIQDKVVVSSDQWQITYAWINLLTNLITQQNQPFSKADLSSQLVNKENIENIWNDLIKKKILLPLSGERALLISENLRELSLKKAFSEEELYQTLSHFAIKKAPRELTEFIYRGDETFKGIEKYLCFGTEETIPLSEGADKVVALLSSQSDIQDFLKTLGPIKIIHSFFRFFLVTSVQAFKEKIKISQGQGEPIFRRIHEDLATLTTILRKEQADSETLLSAATYLTDMIKIATKGQAQFERRLEAFDRSEKTLLSFFEEQERGFSEVQKIVTTIRDEGQDAYEKYKSLKEGFEKVKRFLEESPVKVEALQKELEDISNQDNPIFLKTFIKELESLKNQLVAQDFQEKEMKTLNLPSLPENNDFSLLEKKEEQMDGSLTIIQEKYQQKYEFLSPILVQMEKEWNRDPLNLLTKGKQRLEKILQEKQENITNTSKTILELTKSDTLHTISDLFVPVKSEWFSKMTKLLEGDAWRVREKALSSLYHLKTFAKNELPIEEVQKALLFRKIYETHPKVRLLINNPDWAIYMTVVLQECWQTEQEKIKEDIKERFETLQEVQNQISHEPNLEKQRKIIAYCQGKQKELNAVLDNLTGMQDQMGLAIQFLGDMKSQLFAIQQDLKEIQADVKEIKKGVEFLVGKPIDELFSFRKEMAAQNPALNKVYISIDCYSVENNNEKKPLMDEVLTFITYPKEKETRKGSVSKRPAFKGKTTLLITGEPGAGKSTFMRHLEHELWEKKKAAWKDIGKAESKKIIPIVCSLPRLQQPLTDLVQETLEREYGFDERNIRELKDKAREGIYNIVFILDSYDEINPRYQYKNLYDSNDLELWGNPVSMGFPKVIITSRIEYLESHPGYDSLFHPKISDALEDYDAQSRYMERRIAPFVDQRNDYFNQIYLRSIQRRWDGKKYNQKNMKILIELLNIETPIELSDIKEHFDPVFLQREEKYLEELWSPKKYLSEIKAIPELEEFLKTPFMTEIIVDVLPGIRQELGKESTDLAPKKWTDMI